MAVIVDIADAIEAALTGYSFSLPFAAEMTFDPKYDLKKMKGLYVPVVPRAREWSAVTRGMWQDEMQIDIGVQKKLIVADKVEVAPLVDLAEEIAAFVRETGQFGDGRVMLVENEPVCAPEHLTQYRLFTGVVTVTVKVMV